MAIHNEDLYNTTQDDDLGNILKNYQNRRWLPFYEYLPITKLF